MCGGLYGAWCEVPGVRRLLCVGPLVTVFGGAAAVAAVADVVVVGAVLTCQRLMLGSSVVERYQAFLFFLASSYIKQCSLARALSDNVTNVA